MTRLLPLLMLAITGCAQTVMTCPNARAAALLATQAVVRICPLTIPDTKGR